MKTRLTDIFLIPASLFLCLTGFTSCGNKGTAENSNDSITVEESNSTYTAYELEKGHYKDSSMYITVDIHTSIPKATDEVTEKIRNTLVDLVYKYVNTNIVSSGKNAVKRCNPEYNTVQYITDYYGAALFDLYNEMSEEEIAEALEADGDEYTDEDKESFSVDTSGKVIEYSIKKYRETDRYIIFESIIYSFLGGAHGSAGWESYIFKKEDGSLVKEFFVPDAETRLQNLLSDGLTQYFKEMGEEDVVTSNIKDYLFLDEGQSIPLPQSGVTFTDKGLLFHYDQYEIASYASGMPSFVIPYEKIRPYLTREVKLLLDM